MSDAAAAPLVLVHGPENGVAEIVLNRPDKMNAITADLIRAMVAAAEGLFADPRLRVVVLRGEGRAFCAGLDKGNFGKMAQTGKGSMGAEVMTRSHGRSNLFQYASLVWRETPVPVIAALHGVAFGGGLQIALGADVRIAAPGTRLSVMEMKWGLIPDMGGMTLMKRLMRGDEIRRLIYTAEIVEAEEARALGLVTEVAEDPVARARALAAEIAGRSPSAMRAAKELINLSEEADDATILLEESRLQTGLIGGAHQIEAVMAGMENRPARFA